jgi:hypothetical protein
MRESSALRMLPIRQWTGTQERKYEFEGEHLTSDPRKFKVPGKHFRFRLESLIAVSNKKKLKCFRGESV